MFPSLRQMRFSRRRRQPLPHGRGSVARRFGSVARRFTEPRALASGLALVLPALLLAQAPPMLTLQEAEAMAVRNHPQIQAAQNEVNFANQQIVINRAPYYPGITGEITGSQAEFRSRIGAGDLTDSRLFDREGQGVAVQQLITDSGRTPNLVASARFQAQAAAQNSQATRYTVLLDVNRAYFDVLHAQATVKVAEQTVAARQLLDNQVTELARNKLRSQVDVSFADVNVSEAKLLLLRAQDSVAGALAELGRAMGSDQPANYQLTDEPLPPAPPAAPDALVTQAIDNRPELASLRAARESAYKFAEAEKDLSRPTVSAMAVAGYTPYINNPTTTPIPPEYEAVGANVSIPIFNGHLFSARREAAYQRALESDQQLRNRQQQISRDVRHGLGQRQRRLPAHRRHGAVHAASIARAATRAGTLRFKFGFHRRIDAGAVERHRGRD